MCARANIVAYVEREGDPFSVRGVCRVDSLVFSWLSYFRIPSSCAAARSDEGIALRDLLVEEWLPEMCGPLFDTENSVALLRGMAASPRFRDVVVSNYVERTDVAAEEQFSAMRLDLSDDETFVAYRGTDNTLVGWKEDFNMAFSGVVPSQLSARRYLEQTAERRRGRIWCGGHSKGGNLAVFAGVTCGARYAERVVRCFSHDGPGFLSGVLVPSELERARSLVDKTIPQSSVIGMLFETQEGACMVIRSDGIGFYQHDPFSWVVAGQDFVEVDGIGLGASAIDASLNAWLVSSSEEERERFVDAVFTVLRASGQQSFADLKANWKSAVPRMLLSVAALDPADRRVVTDAVRLIASSLIPSRERQRLAGI